MLIERGCSLFDAKVRGLSKLADDLSDVARGHPSGSGRLWYEGLSGEKNLESALGCAKKTLNKCKGAQIDSLMSKVNEANLEFLAAAFLGSGACPILSDLTLPPVAMGHGSESRITRIPVAPRAESRVKAKGPIYDYLVIQSMFAHLETQFQHSLVGPRAGEIQRPPH